MAACLIRSRAAITRTTSRHAWHEIPDGAVLQEDGTIVAIGTYADLSRKYPNLPVIGSGHEILLPGFINAHHHVGPTPVHLGSPDMPLPLLDAVLLRAKAGAVRHVICDGETIYTGGRFTRVDRDAA